MKKCKQMVFCRNNRHGELDFFLSADGREIYLFTTNYFSREIYEKYRKGQRISELFEKTSKTRQQKLKERILRMSKYTAEMENITLLQKSGKPHRTKICDYDCEAA